LADDWDIEDTLGDEEDLGSGPVDVVRVVIGTDPPDRLDKALARDVPEGAGLSRSRLMRLIAEGAVTRAGVALTDPKARTRAGDVIDIALPPPAPMAAEPEDIPLSILYEDDEVLVIDKPAGMVVHPAPGSPSGTLVNALLHHCGASLSGTGGAWRPGIVHRIDKDTSGLLVVAKTDRAHQGLAAQFAAHTTRRRYLALCQGAPSGADPRLRGLRGVTAEAGGVLRVATHLDRHRHDRQRQAVVQAAGRHAVTRLRLIEAFGEPVQASLAEFWLETGRTHQIRVHASYIGHALVGDPVYGGHRRPAPSALPDGAAQAMAGFPRQALHAASLGFTHPVTGEAMEFESPLSDDLAGLIETLRGA
jgi:23S rRNA pseudouridine1911/1915/1917 synthase